MDLFASLLVIWLALVGAFFVQRRKWTPRERQVIWLSFAAHLFAAIAQHWISFNIYAGGDTLGYFLRAARYADLVTSAPFIWGPRVAAHALQIDIGWPLSAFAGTTAGSLTGLTVLPVLLTGKSTWGTFMAFAFASFFGKVMCLRAARNAVPIQYRTRFAMVFLLLPSVVFWTSGIIKESVAVMGLGIALYGWSRIVNKFKVVSGTVFTAFGSLLIGLVKPYVLFPFVLSAGIWYYWRRADVARRSLRPIHFVVGALVAVGGIVLLGEIFPQYSVNRIGEEAARLQDIGASHRGGSSYDIVEQGQNRTLIEQLGYAPLALATSLFRPLPFEIRNITSAINAIEVFLITLLLIRTWLARGARTIGRMIYRNPFMMFTLTFTVVAGVAIGLATTNLGTLSRYRVPMFPFYVAIIAFAYPLPRRRRRAPDPRSPRGPVA